MIHENGYAVGEQTFKQRLIKAFEDLNNIDTLAKVIIFI